MKYCPCESLRGTPSLRVARHVRMHGHSKIDQETINIHTTLQLTNNCTPDTSNREHLFGLHDSDSDSDAMRARGSSHGSRSMLKRPTPLHQTTQETALGNCQSTRTEHGVSTDPKKMVLKPNSCPRHQPWQPYQHPQPQWMEEGANQLSSWMSMQIGYQISASF